MTQTTQPIQQAAAIVARAHRLTALVGAGLSASSGIPTYRGPGGLWTRQRPRQGAPPLLSYQEFVRDPAAWWQARLAAETDPSHPIYQMKQAVDQAAPNPGHLALAQLEQRGILHCIITQNVDNLHAAAGSRAVLEIHGNRNRLRCLQCHRRTPRNTQTPQNPPQCQQCNGLLKLDTVMFGEPIPPDVLQACRQAAEQSDCMLLVGTSGTVNPAARLPLLAKENGATLIEINPEATPLTPWCDLSLTGPADAILPQLLNSI